MQRGELTFKTGLTYLAPTPDLVKILENQEGSFEAVFNGQAFRVVCLEGHSIESLIPSGTRNVWLITKLEPTPVEVIETPAERTGRR